MIFGTPPHQIGVCMPIVTLARSVVGRMTVETARIPKHLGDSSEGFQTFPLRLRRRSVYLSEAEIGESGENDRQEAYGTENPGFSESNFTKHGVTPWTPLDQSPV